MTPYNVRFIGDYFSLTVSVQVDEDDPQTRHPSEDDIIHLANNILLMYYGWDAKEVSTIDIEVEEN